MSDKISEVQQIQQQIAALQARAALLIMEGRDDAIAQIKAMMADYSIEAADLGLKLKAPPRIRVKRTGRAAGSAAPRPAKYVDPATGATWTGQGRTPNWMEGKNPDDFLVGGAPRAEPAPQFHQAGQAAQFHQASHTGSAPYFPTSTLPAAQRGE